MDRFVISPRNANETGNVSIECTASGNPTPVVTIVNPNGRNVSHSMGRAELNYVHKNKAGFYACKVSNGLNAPINPRIKLVVACMYSIPFFTCLSPLLEKLGFVSITTIIAKSSWNTAKNSCECCLRFPERPS